MTGTKRRVSVPADTADSKSGGTHSPRGLDSHLRHQSVPLVQKNPQCEPSQAPRLIGALLAEQHEVWFTGKRYFDMTEYFEWKEQQKEEQTSKLVKIG